MVSEVLINKAKKTYLLTFRRLSPDKQMVAQEESADTRHKMLRTFIFCQPRYNSALARGLCAVNLILVQSIERYYLEKNASESQLLLKCKKKLFTRDEKRTLQQCSKENNRGWSVDRQSKKDITSLLTLRWLSHCVGESGRYQQSSTRHKLKCSGPFYFVSHHILQLQRGEHVQQLSFQCNQSSDTTLIKNASESQLLMKCKKNCS